MIFSLGLLYIAFIMLRYILFIPVFFRDFIMQWCWNLSKAFSAYIEMSSGFCLCFY
jgi:hypothetical protein